VDVFNRLQEGHCRVRGFVFFIPHTNAYVAGAVKKKSKKRSIMVSELTKSLSRHYMRFWERLTEEMSFQAFHENRH